MAFRIALLVFSLVCITACPSDPVVAQLDAGADVAIPDGDGGVADIGGDIADVAGDTLDDVQEVEVVEEDVQVPEIDAEAPDIAPEDTGPPAPLFGNTCDIPIDIAVATLPFAEEANTAGATDDYSLGGGCDTGGDIGHGIPELVYRFVPALTGHHIIGLSPATFTGENPTVIYIATDCSDFAGSCVAVSGNLTGGGIFSALLEAGQTYWIVADGLLESDKGPFTLIVDEAVCVPLCPGPGTSCGKDGCGGLCGVGCLDDLVCNIDGNCVEAPEVAGNTCSDVFEVGELPFSGSGDTFYGSDQLSVDGGDCPGEDDPMGAASNDHVYKLVAPQTGFYQFSLNSDYDAALYVSESCDKPKKDCIGGSDTSLVEETLELQLTKDQEYYIIVDGFGGDENDTGTYGLTISEPCVPECAGIECGSDGCSGSCGECGESEACTAAGVCATAPTGDTCNDPFVVGELPYSHSADTSDFEGDFYYEAGQCPGVDFGWGKGSSDVVYVFTAPKANLYDLQVTAEFDTTLYVAADCVPGNFTCLQAADEPLSDELISIWLEDGQTVFIIVDGYGNLSTPSGPYTLSVAPACIPACGGKECGDDGCGSTCGECGKGSFCTQMGLCQGKPGDTCETPFLLEEAPSQVSGDTSDASDVYGVPYDACPGEIGVRGAQSRDEVWAFTPEESAVYTFTVDAEFVTSVYVLADCSLFVEDCFLEQDAGPLVWWKITEKCEDTGGACLAIDTGVGVDSSTASATVWLDAGQTYYVIVDGSSFNIDFSGSYTLSVTEPCTPACEGKACGADGCGLKCGECDLGDICSAQAQCVPLDGNTCETAWTIDSLPWVAEGSTYDATNVYGLPKNVCEDQEDPGGAGSNDEVYAFTPDESALYDVTLEANFDTLLYVLNDCEAYKSSCFYPEALGYYQWVATQGDCSFGDECIAMAFPEDTEPMKVELEEGQTYYIVVDGSAGLANYWGTYTLTVDKACVPQCEDKECGDDGCGEPCDTCPDGFECSAQFKCIDVSAQDGNTCATAWEVGTIPFLAAGDTTDDADIYPPNQCAGDVPGSKDEVWIFTPQQTGVFVFSVKPDPPFETVYSIVTACADLNFECVVGTDAETISETLEGGVSYYIIVDSDEDGSQEGTYVLEIKEAP